MELIPFCSWPPFEMSQRAMKLKETDIWRTFSLTSVSWGDAICKRVCLLKSCLIIYFSFPFLLSIPDPWELSGLRYCVPKLWRLLCSHNCVELCKISVLVKARITRHCQSHCLWHYHYIIPCWRPLGGLLQIHKFVSKIIGCQRQRLPGTNISCLSLAPLILTSASYLICVWLA